MYARLFFSLAWFALAIGAHETQARVGVTLVSMILLYAQHGGLLIWRSLRLLLWLFVPIILLHAWFTPGVYLWGLPISEEGLRQALLLCLQLLNMFFAALLVMKLWQRQHVFFWIQKNKWLQQVLLPYVILLPALREAVGQVLQLQKQAWQSERKPWAQLPEMLASSVRQVVEKAKVEARCVWRDWDVLVVRMQNHELASTPMMDAMLWLLGALAWLVLWQA